MLLGHLRWLCGAWRRDSQIPLQNVLEAARSQGGITKTISILLASS